MDEVFILGKNSIGWYIWSQKRDSWVSRNNREDWTKNADFSHWLDASMLVLKFRDGLGYETAKLEVGHVSNY